LHNPFSTTKHNHILHILTTVLVNRRPIRERQVNILNLNPRTRTRLAALHRRTIRRTNSTPDVCEVNVTDVEKGCIAITSYAREGSAMRDVKNSCFGRVLHGQVSESYVIGNYFHQTLFLQIMGMGEVERMGSGGKNAHRMPPRPPFGGYPTACPVQVLI